ncbi:radical SAM protein [Thermococcus indicus]|uniref:Radical SAM protein n=1 Tax=Thermococcus indicus TaxID=2586643 RepID=A0A4Y5SL13_9EURY|nr:radical SAM protein [Thermococcus indicus]QDA31546.1 radical SAM protein [Thermococcus indicus]
MEILSEVGDPNVAVVYIGRTFKGNIVEFVESIPTYNPAEKWVLIVSSLNGCPVGCKMCDAGFFYKGRLSLDELMEQIEYPIQRRWNGKPKTRKFKVQFARMGEPSFNMAVIEAMRLLGERYENFHPSLSTIAPIGTNKFFERLLELKKEMFPTNFQLQFSIHSTNPEQRDEIIPVRKWDFEKIAEYGKAFYDEGGKKITLNFALARENEADANVIAEYFPKEYFLIKITPLNPTVSALKNRLTNDVDLETGLPMKHKKFVDDLRRLGYDVIISVGDTRENLIGSNCGQYILRFLKERPELREAYTFARGFEFRVS